VYRAPQVKAFIPLLGSKRDHTFHHHLIATILALRDHAKIDEERGGGELCHDSSSPSKGNKKYNYKHYDLIQSK
jgi:hypothetical protein